MNGDQARATIVLRSWAGESSALCLSAHLHDRQLRFQATLLRLVTVRRFGHPDLTLREPSAR